MRHWIEEELKWKGRPDFKSEDDEEKSEKQKKKSDILIIDAKTKHTYLSFAPDTLVRTAEIKPGLNETYTRAFLWFNRVKSNEYFTVGNLLSFISEISLHDPKTFQLEMQKQWQTVYRFKSTFDLNKPLTRREFAVLTNKFLNPFARYVDITGRLVN